MTAWGKLLSVTGTLATTLGADQPFRYRGYVYDEETGWYYLQSRYYDPTTCRFISADICLSTGQGVIGHNAFAYCLDNPIILLDIDAYYATPVPINEVQLPKSNHSSGVPANPNYSPYIDNQHDQSIASLHFGLGTIGNNGCGLIALYNVSVASGNRETFKHFRQRYAYNPFKDLGLGLLGTNPIWLTTKLKNMYGTKNIFTTKKSNVRYNAIIVLYKGRDQTTNSMYIHYFAAISIGNGKYRAYNDCDIGEGSLSDILDSVPGTIIRFWGIRF